jgi:acetylcholinesterase
MMFGDGSDEFAGGTGLGTAAKLVDDTFAKLESSFWWSKTELSEK